MAVGDANSFGDGMRREVAFPGVVADAAPSMMTLATGMHCGPSSGAMLWAQRT